MRSGDAFWNPLTGEKAMIVESADERDGASIVIDFAVEEGGFLPGGEHVHDHSTEHFEVQAGRIAFDLDGETRTLAVGEQVTVAPGTWHRWWNAGEGEVRARVRVEQILHFEEAILVFWGLCADRHTNAEGRPSPLFGALAGQRFRREVRLRRPPEAVQRLVFPPLAALARRRDLERTIDRYLDLNTHPSAEAGLGHLPEQVMRRTNG